MLRLFFAIHVPALEPLSAAARKLIRRSGTVRRVPAADWHITLKFLGETEKSRLEAVRSLASEIIAAAPPMTLSLCGVGAFPSPRRPSILWAGIEDNRALAQLAAEMEAKFERLGYAAEQRRFRPHVTLARLRSRPPAELEPYLLQNADLAFGAFAVSSVELLNSELGPDGPTYRSMDSFVLSATD